MDASQTCVATLRERDDGATLTRPFGGCVMAIPRAPFYVSFQTDNVPTTFDHTQSSPGPGGGAADRAGHTSVRVKPRMTTVWDNGAPRSDGRSPFYAVSINVFFRLQDFIVGVSSDYRVGSCAYNATVQHELDAHILRPMRIFRSFRDPLISRLNAINIPTQSAPLWLTSAEMQRAQERLMTPVVAAIEWSRGQIAAALRSDGHSQDDAQHYRLVYNQCSPADWAAGRTP